jgi:hypothetical protein
MSEDRFPYEADNSWVHDPATKLKWYQALEDTGPENVRAILAQSPHGSGASISVGDEISMTKGYAQRWLAWHDRKKAERESAFRSTQIFWTRWAAIVATVIAVGYALNWMFQNL